MNAIRKDEELDNIHSIYVDQWDWEKIIRREERNEATLATIVKRIYVAFRENEAYICGLHPDLDLFVKERGDKLKTLPTEQVIRYIVLCYDKESPVVDAYKKLSILVENVPSNLVEEKLQITNKFQKTIIQ